GSTRPTAGATQRSAARQSMPRHPADAIVPELVPRLSPRRIPMLFIREVHRVIGAKQDAFEAAYRDGYMPLVAQDPGSRLLWFFNLAHGAGLSYNVVTVTGVAAWADWVRLVLRMQDGDLASWSQPVDSIRCGRTASVVVPT